MINKKFLYLISQNEVNEYDSFDSAVVCAESEENARDTNPRGGEKIDWTVKNWGSWATKRESVKVEFLGKAEITRPVGVVCASFNAG